MQKFLYFILSIAFVVPTGVFAASNLPAVQSKLVKGITHNSASIYATMTPGTQEDNAYWFEWGIVGSNDDIVFKTSRHTMTTRSGQREVYATIRGLSPNTQYYFKIVGENQGGSVSGDLIYFTTRNLDNHTESVIIATTRNVLNIKEESAKVFGYVAPHNKTARYWFEWGTDEKVESRSKTLTISRDGGEVESLITSLIPGTTYYYRVVAEGDSGATNGELKSFKTKGVKPVLEVKKDQTAGAISPKTTKTVDGEDAKKVTSNNSLLGSIFGTSKTTKTTKTDTVKTDKNTSKTASVANSVKDVTVSVKPIGVGGAHQTIEYKVSYKYSRKNSADKAELKVTFPKSVAYVADTTADELLVVNNKDGSRTYVLPIGTLKKGDTRTFSIIGMLTADTKKIPVVEAKLSFNSDGTRMIAGSLVASAASAGSTGTGLSFPTTLLSIVAFLIVVVVSITIIMKLKDSYQAAVVRADEANKKSAEATKKIEDSLVVKKPVEVVAPSVKIEEPTIVSTHMTPIPMKPKIFDEVNNNNINEFGLPGMEVVTN